MPLQTNQDLFHFDLSVALSMEREFVQILGTLAGEVQDQQLKQALQTHQQQTQQHVQRIQQAFQDMGKQPLDATDQTVRGMKTQHDDFLQYHGPSKAVLDMFDASAAHIGEEYEIAKYQALIQAANRLNHERVTALLQQNLQDEQQADQKLEGIIQQMMQQPAADG